MKRIATIVLTMGVLAASLFGQKVGKYAGEFLAIGVGGRALGLGGAYVALANDASAGYWNPAALVRINYPEIMVMHDERFGNLMNYDFGAVAIPYGQDASLGLTVIRMGIDGIPDTRNAWVDANGNGVFDDNNRPDYDKITYFNSADWAFYLTYAKKVDESFAYGANVKFIRRDIADGSATGIGFDAGLIYTPKPQLLLGVNIQDVTTTLVAWNTGRTELITPTAKVGASYFIEAFDGRFAPSLDLDMRLENRRYAAFAHIWRLSIDPRVGIEFDFRKTVALRLGYSDVGQFTVGAGLHLRKLDIDYCFARFGSQADNLGDTHRISLRLILEEERYAR